MVWSSPTTIRDCFFSGSVGGTGDGKNGGSMVIKGASNVSVIDSVFEDTQTLGSGAVYIVGGAYVEFVRTRFERGMAADRERQTAMGKWTN